MQSRQQLCTLLLVQFDWRRHRGRHLSKMAFWDFLTSCLCYAKKSPTCVPRCPAGTNTETATPLYKTRKRSYALFLLFCWRWFLSRSAPPIAFQLILAPTSTEPPPRAARQKQAEMEIGDMLTLEQEAMILEFERFLSMDDPVTFLSFTFLFFTERLIPLFADGRASAHGGRGQHGASPGRRRSTVFSGLDP